MERKQDEEGGKKTQSGVRNSGKREADPWQRDGINLDGAGGGKRAKEKNEAVEERNRDDETVERFTRRMASTTFKKVKGKHLKKKFQKMQNMKFLYLLEVVFGISNVLHGIFL